MENLLDQRFLNQDERKLEDDFFSALQNYGVDPSFINRYKESGSSSGWDFKPVEPSELDERASQLFVRSIEIEEEIVELKDPIQLQEKQDELKVIKVELDQLQKLINEKKLKKEWQNW
eukprot:TRINITY_DN11319_c0_g1_i1.p1 TRINITY_DN11319_c0_g1~~TRINITY_DN11319_c0_g1_i1.p1  ORF type:complete len:118 (-),score=43.94 TRINITY_DN11319_c0_g1_i1:11-364(-)